MIFFVPTLGLLHIKKIQHDFKNQRQDGPNPLKDLKGLVISGILGRRSNFAARHIGPSIC